MRGSAATLATERGSNLGRLAGRRLRL